MLESEILHEVALALGSRPDVRLWRQNTGVGRALHSENVVRFGVNGGGDLSGVLLVEAGGLRLGLRLEVEVKAAKGRQREDQKAFERMMRRMGAVYLLVRSAEQAVSDLELAKGEIVEHLRERGPHRGPHAAP